MSKKVQLHDLDTKLKFGPKVKLSIESGFKELYVPNLSKSLSQIEEVMDQCCNLNLRLVIKTRACKGAGQEGSPGVTSHAPGSVGECEGMNPHTPSELPL
jgi:hypothetical protein